MNRMAWLHQSVHGYASAIFLTPTDLPSTMLLSTFALVFPLPLAEDCILISGLEDSEIEVELLEKLDPGVLLGGLRGPLEMKACSPMTPKAAFYAIAVRSVG